jgi:hypothetical protein
MMDFKDFTAGFRNSTPRLSKHTTDAPKLKVPDDKRRQLIGQIARVIHELGNTPALSDTDRRLLNISSAVAYLLAGR